MKRIISIFILFLATALAQAADHGTTEEAVALVHKAIASFKSAGREKTLDDVNRGKFVLKDLYITVWDGNGVNLAHSVTPKIVGKNMLGVRDADGKAFMQEAINLQKTQDKGWINFRWPNPVSGKIEAKSTYIERYGDMSIACGVYKGE